MISDARGGHVSPGIYTEEKDVVFSVKSLGITSLGLVGETLYGPAFENIEIENWGQFVDYFGGTSPEKFKGTGLPKYELPYIAKSYLEESKRLNVVRVLGLSGYKSSPAWVIKSSETDKPAVILRGKVVYGDNAGSICEPITKTPAQVVKNVEVVNYTEKQYNSYCQGEESTPSENQSSKGKFGLKVTTYGTGGYSSEYVYNVSLTPSDSDYIYKVLSSRPDTGTTPIYIEAVYESSLGDTKSISTAVTKCESGNIEEEQAYEFNKSVYFSAGTGASVISGYVYTYKKAEAKNNVTYTTTGLTAFYDGSDLETAASNFDNSLYISGATEEPSKKNYRLTTETNVDDMYEDFKEMYRPAQTPWIVSDVTAGDSATMRKLFKFITISDGEISNFQIKVSIQNIKPEEGTFDVVVRDFYDDDAAPVILEKFSKCSLVEGDASYLPFKIGSVDGGYASKSKYIAVEMAEGEDFSNNVPAGFLGYPMPKYGLNEKVEVSYNTEVNTYIKPKRQYFGLNNKVIDTDVLKYKGRYFYDNMGDADPSKITNGFHMDSILSVGEFSDIYVDGVAGYVFSTVAPNPVSSKEELIPRLINAPYMNNTIYKDIALRKFTVYFYGGFDGWDVNRESRTNTDEFKASRYSISENDTNEPFGHITENGLNLSLNLPATAITSDYYAYLAGYRRFANPQDVDINVFATPGIDWWNNSLLTEEALDVIEDADDGRGGDALYIMAPPRDVDADELVEYLETTELDSSYAATYFPWVMYYDSSNKRYIDLPVTKDVVRNMAKTDNESFPWFAPAGKERGEVKCIKAMHKTTLTEEDKLYEGRINPVKSFALDGVKIWGNKTVYSKESPLNRVNVRRLMIRVKKLISDAATHLIFEQYDDTLEKQFRGLVEPILADVKSKRGIYDFRVITEVTPETRDQHILPAKILIKPTPALEYISISFVVYPESVAFEEN